MIRLLLFASWKMIVPRPNPNLVDPFGEIYRSYLMQASPKWASSKLPNRWMLSRSVFCYSSDESKRRSDART